MARFTQRISNMRSKIYSKIDLLFPLFEGNDPDTIITMGILCFKLDCLSLIERTEDKLWQLGQLQWHLVNDADALLRAVEQTPLVLRISERVKKLKILLEVELVAFADPVQGTSRTL